MNSSTFFISGLMIMLVILLFIILKLRRDLSFHELQEKELDEYATEVEMVYRQMRAIRHDYRNHLQVMSAYIEAEQIDELQTYILQLTNEMNQVDTIIRTGNTMVDALVNTKLSRAKEKGVALYATAIAPENLGIDNVDLAIILGNLLNNALEATSRQLHDEVRQEENFIRLYIAPMKNNLYISMTNTMATNPQPNFLSLKAPNRQGYGLKRINQVVEKYNGILNRQWEDGVFATEVTLPIRKMEKDTSR